MDVRVPPPEDEADEADEAALAGGLRDGPSRGEVTVGRDLTTVTDG